MIRDKKINISSVDGQRHILLTSLFIYLLIYLLIYLSRDHYMIRDKKMNISSVDGHMNNYYENRYLNLSIFHLSKFYFNISICFNLYIYLSFCIHILPFPSHHIWRSAGKCHVWRHNNMSKKRDCYKKWERKPAIEHQF